VLDVGVRVGSLFGAVVRVLVGSAGRDEVVQVSVGAVVWAGRELVGSPGRELVGSAVTVVSTGRELVGSSVRELVGSAGRVVVGSPLVGATGPSPDAAMAVPVTTPPTTTAPATASPIHVCRPRTCPPSCSGPACVPCPFTS